MNGFVNQTLAQWLVQTCKCHDVQAVRVEIDGELFDGCRYKQTHEYTADMDAVKWGKRKAGDKYHWEAIYCLGRVPKSYGKPPRPGKSTVTRAQKVCYTFEGMDWYVSGYVQSVDVLLNPKWAGSHPFGLHFMLAPWNIPNSKIDDYEPKPYVRHEMKVTLL
jgi:hypothetical protein